MKLRILALVSSAAVILAAACSTSSSSTGAQPDGGSGSIVDGGGDGATCASPVSGKCTTEGATACGRPALCTDVGDLGFIDCTCSGGIWDCRKCGDCTPGMATCGNTSACQGGTATRCDGTTVKVVQCNCGYFVDPGQGPWQCTDFDGNKFSTGCGDAGLDAHGD